ncbi:MAG: M20/M25/M40 family metallo-hydrolase [Clostridia bacterium]|nr:M20/M25/M40 family metallo-hydrolase [Clostridia bacterium]
MKDLLFSLSAAACTGYIHDAAVLAEAELKKYATVTRTGNTVIGQMGDGDYTLLLDAHIDEIALTVTDVDEQGFLTVANCGGFDPRTLPARPVNVHTKSGVIPAVFCSTPPHLSSGEINYDSVSALKIDSLLGEDAKNVIALGDLITYDMRPVALAGNRVSGKSFDNRAGVTCLLELARRISGKDLPFKIVFVFSDQEELGCRGAKTATYAVNPDEAIVLDVSFGDGPDIGAYECGKLSCGGMIGCSPVLDREISDKLIDLAHEHNIPYQTEAMGRSTGTNSDVISVVGNGVRTGLISIPLRNMHTDTEVVDLDDMTAVVDLLEQYILSGGVSRD